MKHYAKNCLAILTASLLIMGCSKKASDEIDFGKVENSTYKNEYFPISITLPAEWTIQDQESRKRLMDAGTKLMAGDDKNLNAAIKASEMLSVNLVTAFQHPVGAPVNFNPSIICVAEKINHMPGIKKGSDYLYHTKKMIEASQMELSFSEEISSESLGSQSFDYMTTDIAMGGQVIHQKYYATIIKGYALTIVISYTTDEQKSTLEAVLDSVEFE